MLMRRFHAVNAALVAVTLVHKALADEGEEEGEEEGAETEEFANTSVSMMLLGGVGFIMVLYELTQCYKTLVKKNTWEVLSNTISIFVSVLLFTGVHGMLERYVLEEASAVANHAAMFAHALTWWLLLQVLLAGICGVVNLVPCYPVDVEDSRVMTRRVKTFGILLGHITGFAFIKAFCSIQEHLQFSVLAVLAMAPFAWFCLFCLGHVANDVRMYVAKMGDDRVDPHEELWDEVVEETEDDIIGLVVSFCFAQGLRYFITGVLPNAEGEEPLEMLTQHTRQQCLKLVGSGILIFLLTSMFMHKLPKWLAKRQEEQLELVSSMIFAWAFFFSAQWSLASLSDQEGVIGRVVLALLLTVIAIFSVLVLVELEEADWTDDHVDAVIRAMIGAIGIMIGFAWEKSFDEAVLSIAESVKFVDGPIAELLLGVVLSLMVVPAWYRHIYPTFTKEEAKFESERQEKEEKEVEAKFESERQDDDCMDESRPLLVECCSPMPVSKYK